MDSSKKNLGKIFLFVASKQRMEFYECNIGGWWLNCVSENRKRLFFAMENGELTTIWS